jgi:UDP-glucuronate decarboxylase
MRELAELIITLVGSTSKVVTRPLPIDDPRQRRPDISKARALLGWSPSIPMREGLAKTIDYFDTLLANPSMAGAIGR